MADNDDAIDSTNDAMPTSVEQSDFVRQLTPLLCSPWPGCLFIQASSHSDQVDSLKQIRSLLSSLETSSQWTELHPHLMSSSNIDLYRDIEASFPDKQGQSSRSMSSSSSAISIFPQAANGHSLHRLIIISGAHILRSTHSPLIWSQLLHPPSGYTTLLLSSLSLDRWRTAEGIETSSAGRPIAKLSYSAEKIVASSQGVVLPNDLALPNAVTSTLDNQLQAAITKFKPTFISYVYPALAAEIGNGDVEEIEYLSSAMWVALVRAAAEGGGVARFKETHTLLALLRPMVRHGLQRLYPRTISLTDWTEQAVRAATGQLQAQDESSRRSNPKSAGRTTLPPLASILLLSAFLASHLAPRLDSRFFLRDSSILSSFKSRSKRRRRQAANDGLDNDDDGGKTNSSSLLLGPKPFALQRMVYLCQNLCVEFGIELSSFQGDWARKKRRRQREEEGHRSFLGEEEEEEDGDKAGNENALDIHSLAVQQALMTLVQAGYISYLGPPASSSTASAAEDLASAGSVIVSLPPVPVRLEFLNQVTLRCDLLKDELRGLVVGQGEDDSATTEDLKRGLERREWWTRLEECGL